jgi:hypothetical protein
MSNTLGTKETVDVLRLALFLARVLVEEAKGDGFQLTDLIKILTSSEFLDRVAAAGAGLGEVPKEFADLDQGEGIDLAIYALTEVKDIARALKAA